MEKKQWGGSWTEEKLVTFEKYVKAYLKIMNKNRNIYGWKLLYFDGFAGSGTRSSLDLAEERRSVQDLFGESISNEELNVYKGAAERIVSIEHDGIRSFDKYYFIDKNQENCDALERKLSEYDVKGRKYFIHLDANEAIKRLANTLRVHRNVKTLLFLDPFGMQVNWNSVSQLRGLSIDLWILVPTGVIVNRLLERKFDVTRGFSHAEKLESFFGLNQEEIRKYFYTEKVEPSLFGDEETSVIKVENSIRKIAELYIDRLHTIFPFVSEEPLVLANNRNLPIYHLIFASQKKVAQKIAQQIIKSNE